LPLKFFGRLIGPVMISVFGIFYFLCAIQIKFVTKQCRDKFLS
jgi:hypothetical protein